MGLWIIGLDRGVVNSSSRDVGVGEGLYEYGMAIGISNGIGGGALVCRFGCLGGRGGEGVSRGRVPDSGLIEGF